MPDPLLTSLCSICHITPPKYKCPRCHTQTCSLTCTKKHKSWSQCTGHRDPTTYIPPSRLRTPAGVDHDYNFLHGIELSLERSEKILIQEKKLLQEEELRPLTVQQVRWKIGKDGRRRKVLVTQALREAHKARKLDKALMHKLRTLNVQLVHVPTGMARQRDNHTTLHRKTGRIHWQVEWLTWAPHADETKSAADKREQTREGEGESSNTLLPTERALSKVMDDVPLYKAYQAVLEDKKRAEMGQAGSRPPMTTTTATATRTTRYTEGQQSGAGRSRWWDHKLDCIQDVTSGSWVPLTGAHLAEWPAQRDALERKQYSFYIAASSSQSGTPAPLAAAATLLTPLDPGARLCDIVPETRVVEFPTLYVLPAKEALPMGYVLASKLATGKRKDGPADYGRDSEKDAVRRGMIPMGKRRKQVVSEDYENGEVDGMGGDEELDAVNEEGAGLEAGEILAEESLGEDEEEDEDDETSSSGSDSEEG
ncbi:hypothetical protein E4U13_006172 [Claviceps humidiphila]|uniref:Box C/D snoRNA protein 1 n=1 Tax=Claviceps humidiphila TaxID=1294629 RepID=A0A9P7PZH6_9HYPO|nr:hypothetical protein E4U13_006172 [Claviceps humidiphila]